MKFSALQHLRRAHLIYIYKNILLYFFRPSIYRAILVQFRQIYEF